MADSKGTNESQETNLAVRVAQIVDFVQKNTKLVSGLAIGIILIVVISVLMFRSKKKANKQASGQLGVAQMALQRGDTSDAEVKLENVIDRYDGTKSAGYALALLGKLAINRGNYDQAEQYLNQYLNNYRDEKFITSQVLSNLANCIYVSGDFQNAAQKYEKAAKKAPHKFQKNRALLDAAKCYLENSQINEAEKLVKRVKDNSPDGKIEARIKQLESQIAAKKA